MSDEKLCPFKFVTLSPSWKCEKEKCAWWVGDVTKNECAISNIAINLEWLRVGYNK